MRDRGAAVGSVGAADTRSNAWICSVIAAFLPGSWQFYHDAVIRGLRELNFPPFRSFLKIRKI